MNEAISWIVDTYIFYDIMTKSLFNYLENFVGRTKCKGHLSAHRALDASLKGDNKHVRAFNKSRSIFPRSIKIGLRVEASS